MSQALALLNLTPSTAPPGLVRVSECPYEDIAVDERVAVQEAYSISEKIDYIFFRRFSDGRSSQIAAYVIDGTRTKISKDELSILHHQIWLSGLTPLLYVGRQDRVDVVHCASGPSRNEFGWVYTPTEIIKTISEVSEKLANLYSAYRLADGTVWEEAEVAKQIKYDKSAHKVLIDKVKHADKQLDGKKNPTARRLLLLTLLIKYLEDRSVFPPHWFSNYQKGAKNFLDILESSNVADLVRLIRTLERKFNGDIFRLPDEGDSITSEMLKEIARVIDATELNGQLYFWELYSFEHIPVEVLSHIYQHFAEEDKGAIFTPPLLVNLLLDSVMPYKNLQGKEKILDPTCGSGIFLISAFRRMVHFWRAKNNWEKPSPEKLKEILANHIFGIELQDEAARIASFSLALGICDALKPDVIWKDLKFNKLIDRNIHIGKFEKIANTVKEQATNGIGFDIIVGNPPFKSSLDKDIIQNVKAKGYKISDRSLANYILYKCTHDLLRPKGNICIIQKYDILYNKNPFEFRVKYFSDYKVTTIFDFISIRGMFQGADTKIVAIHASNEAPLQEHAIKHWTFRRTFATLNHFVFELDYYDHHSISQNIAVNDRFVWKANLLGGGRLHFLTKRLNEMPTLKDYFEGRKWAVSEGYIVGKKYKQEEASWLTNLPLLSSGKFTSDYIEKSIVEEVGETHFERPRTKQNFTPPLLLIKKNINLYCAFWDDSPLAYKSRIVGISGKSKDGKALKQFRSKFIRFRRLLQTCCYIFGNSALTVKATALQKNDIEQLPWPDGLNWMLAEWEEIIIEDIVKYIADYIRLGQESALLNKKPSQEDIIQYCDVFLRMMKKTYPEMNACGEGQSNGLRFQAFCFGNSKETDWLDSADWLHHLRSTIFKEYGEALRTVRVLRIYDRDTLILIKPNLLRYWINSTAIRDVDGTVSDIISSGE